jgi:hypothetical protein
MKRGFFVGVMWVCLIGLITLSGTLLTREARAAEPVTLEVLDPTGAIEVTNLFAPRLADLNGKTICELSNDSWEARRTFSAIRELLQRQFPTVKIIPYTEFAYGNIPLESAKDIGDVALKKGCQAAIVGNAG